MDVQSRVLDALTDPAIFIESLFFIIDQDSKRVPFLLNSVQKDYMKFRTKRDIIVKARKLGFSSLIDAEFLHACMIRPNTRAVVISHDKDSAKRLFRRVQYYRRTCKIGSRVQIESSTELSFPATNSYFYIGAAGSRAFGRGDDITHLHLSEAAWYPDETIITATQEAMVKSGGRIVIESTANGAGTAFHKLWLNAINGRSEWKAHFYAWWQDPLNSRISQPLDLQPEEKRLKEAFNLSWDQLAWRRYKLNEMQDPSLFVQEHPGSWEESFLASGRLVFDWQSILAQEKGAGNAKWIGHLVDRGSSVGIESDPRGPFSQWVSPGEKRRYLIVADAADGIQGAAYSVADVYDIKTWEQIAQFRGHPTPMEFGIMLARIGLYYNWALVAVENNTPGNAVLVKLQDISYPNLYDEPGEAGDRLGFMTTEKSKSEYLSDARQCVSDGSIKINSPATIAELRTFVIDEKGKMGPQSGCWQDTTVVMSKACNILKRWVADYSDERKKHSFREVMRLGPRASIRGGVFNSGGVV